MAKNLGPTEYSKTEFKASNRDTDGFRYSVDGKKLFRAPGRLKEYNIPEGVEVICDGAFEGRVTYEKIKLPSTLKHIGSFTFYGCKNLRTIIPTDSIESIGSYAFGGTLLKSINIHFPCTVPDNAFSILSPLGIPEEQLPVNPIKEYYKFFLIFKRNFWLCLFGMLIIALYLINIYKGDACIWLWGLLPVLLLIAAHEIYEPFKTAKRFKQITGIAFPQLLTLDHRGLGWDGDMYYVKFLKPLDSGFISQLIAWEKDGSKYSNNFFLSGVNYQITIDVEKSAVFEFRTYYI